MPNSDQQARDHAPGVTDLTGRKALVTGGAQGIGKCIARTFLELGASVAVMDADAEAVDLVRQAYSGLGRFTAVAGDVASEDDVKACVRTAAADLGGLDILVNNAGIMDFTPLGELELEKFSRILSVNLTGAWLCAKHAHELLGKAKGAMVNISSTRALQSEADATPYSASKAGLVGLTHSLAVSLGPDVRVNCIQPGWIDVSRWKKHPEPENALRPVDHAQHPAGRVGRPEDVAGLAAWLAGPQAGFVTGACFVIDGGMTRKMIYAS